MLQRRLLPPEHELSPQESLELMEALFTTVNLLISCVEEVTDMASIKEAVTWCETVLETIDANPWVEVQI